MGCARSTGLRPFHEAFELQEVIGAGIWGEVYMAVERASREQYAVRVVQGTNTKELVRQFRKEGNLWRSLAGCKYIVQWFTIRAEGQTLFVMMEKCQCTFLEKVQSVSNWSLQKTTDSFRQMLRAIAWVHDCNVVHRNIKVSNFLFGGGEGDNSLIKLTDFADAAALPSSSLLYEEAGSAKYMSVEMLSGAGYTERTDIWSFGVMAYALLFGEFPYASRETNSATIKETILRQTAEPRFIHVPSGDKAGEFLGPAARFCRMLLRRNADIRCSAVEAQKLGFITGQDTAMETQNNDVNMLPHRYRQSIAEAIASPISPEVFGSTDSERSDFSKKLIKNEIKFVPMVKFGDHGELA